MKTATGLFACLLLTFPSAAVHSEPVRQDYDYVVANYFWGDLYSRGGWSLYCGYKFNQQRKTESGKVIDVGHIYPVGRMLENVACRNRLQCFESNNESFREMEADLHNMYPVWFELVTMRNNPEFGEIEGEHWRFDDCDYEWRSNRVEPRDIARGNIARAVLYMHDTYDLPVDPETLATLKEWNRKDPPSKQEKYRNDRIEKLQGRRNPYIDTPALADGLRPSVGRR